MIHLTPAQTDKITTTAIIIAAATMMALLFYLSISVPVVHFSHSQHQCIRVIPASAGSCNQLPKKYSTTWLR